MMRIPFDSAFSAFGGSATTLQGFDTLISPPPIQSIEIKTEKKDNNDEFSFDESTTKFNELMAESFTVSPQELMSTGSSIFSVIESPSMPLSEGNGVCSTSPLFDEQELGPTDEWVSLFSSEQAAATKNTVSDYTNESQSCTSDTPEPLFPVLPPASSCTREVESKPSPTGRKRQKNTSGSTYTKRPRTTPLPEISTDSNDPIAFKRARNTEAARRSRARKMERMEELEGMVSELTRRNEELESQLRLLRKQVSNN